MTLKAEKETVKKNALELLQLVHSYQNGINWSFSFLANISQLILAACILIYNDPAAKSIP